MPTPNYDLGILITLNVSITMIGLLIAVVGVWALMRQLQTNARESREGMREIQATGERVARIAERIDARLRRQFPDIGSELGD